MIAAIAAALVCISSPTVTPVDGHVTDWFRRPGCGWCAGNRGLEFVTAPGAPVRAPVDGTVAFSGPVGGVTYLVIRVASAKGVADPVFAVLGGVESPADTARLTAGDPVVVGAAVGQSAGWLFFGVRVGPRRDHTYLDPAPLFGIGRKPARLVGVDPMPVSLTRRLGSRIAPANPYHCSALQPVVASARESGP